MTEPRVRPRRKQRVGLDMDGTITAMPEVFSALSNGLKLAGHDVFVVTFRPEWFRKETEAELVEMGIAYDELLMGPEGTVDPDWKADVARSLKLTMFFEDMPDVLNAIGPGVQKAWIVPPNRRIAEEPAEADAGA